MNYKAMAEKLGIRYNGIQKYADEDSLVLFTDSQTGSTFDWDRHYGETLADRLRRHREKWVKQGGKLKGI